MADKKFTITTDIPAGKLYEDSLQDAIKASSLSGKYKHLGRYGDELTIVFDSALTVAEETELHGDATPAAAGSILGDHTGEPPPKTQTLAASKFREGLINITSDTTWTKVGGAVTAPSALSNNLDKCEGRITARYKVVEGAGGEKPEIRMLQDPGEAGELALLNITALADTGGSWANLYLSCADNVPTSGLHYYCVEARLNGSVSLELEDVSVSLVEKK